MDIAPGSPGDLVIYRLDESDRIVEVNDAWDRFARANGGESVLGELVLGTRLFQHVSGEATRFLVDAMLRSVRASGERLTRRYRCDSPGVRRELEMTLHPEARERMLLEHRVLSIRRVEPEVRFLPVDEWLDAIKRCSLCNRVRAGGAWVEADAAARSGALAVEKAVRVYYGICPSCRPDYTVR